MFSNNAIIGLDIGSDSIKIVEVRQVQLQTFGVAHHDVELKGYWDSSSLRRLARVVEDILEGGDFAGVKTVVSVQSKDVYVTTMDFDSGFNKRQIQNEIEKQAPYFLPYPPDEMRLSWSKIDNDPRIETYTGKQRVIINALPDFVIENSKNLLEHCNLDGIALENQTISQIRACLTPDRGNTVLVDYGANQTTFSIVVDGILRSSSHIPVGSSGITKELAESLGLDMQIANFLKKDFGLVNLYQLPKPVQDGLSILKSELSTFVELNKKISQIPDKIVFTGGGVYIAVLMSFFKSFPIPCYLANSTRSVVIQDEYKPYIFPIINELSTSIGLAIKDDV